MRNSREILGLLRSEMVKHNISAYIIPTADPHGSEYIPDHWKEREWISGFTGSAGTFVVTLTKSALWTDSRYFLQAEKELSTSEIILMKQGNNDTPDIYTWIVSELTPNSNIGINSLLINTNEFQLAQQILQSKSIHVVSTDLIRNIWTSRPPVSSKSIFLYQDEYCGLSYSSKLLLVRNALTKNEANCLVLSSLDEIAWLFNIRGTDIDYNPVVIAYAIVEPNSVTLFIDQNKVTNEAKRYFDQEHISLASYESIETYIANLPSSYTVWIDGNKLNHSVFEQLNNACKIINNPSPIILLKSIKNEIESTQVKQAMLNDGIAMTRFFYWLYTSIQSIQVTEISLSKALYKLRKEQPNFICESFSTISGYQENGAIVHYHANKKTDKQLRTEDILLIDSGGQYLEGTTDITRTISLGNPTEQQKTDYTLVLKGHIAIATAIFPEGTRGAQLDTLARIALWKNGINYGHGTGHGVGHFLNVHEGPQSIRPDLNPTQLLPGMILSNEPGVYRQSKYGIRIENLIQVVPAFETEFGSFLKFDTLTLFPYDIHLIQVEILDDTEIDWINNYHNRVAMAISPFLNHQETEWLSNACKPLSKKQHI